MKLEANVILDTRNREGILKDYRRHEQEIFVCSDGRNYEDGKQ